MINITSLVRHISYGILLITLTACGGGGSSAPAPTPATPIPTPTPDPVPVSGGGVKGPLANAVVTVYAFDASQSGFRGAEVATASTDTNAAITGLALPAPVTPPYIMAFTSTPGSTTDITTGQFPVITTLRTVITQALLDGGDQIYATPLTTMAVDIAVANAQDTNGTTGIQADEFETALTVAAAQVVSTVGFGMSGNIDIFDMPPLVDNTTATTAELRDVAAYRTAIEALTAIVFAMEADAASGSVDTIFAELIDDLAADGLIDGNVAGGVSAVYTNNTLMTFAQDPKILLIPNTTIPVSEVETLLATEAAVLIPAADTTDLTDGTINPVVEVAEPDPDTDNDTILNADDNCPTVANTGQTNTDGDSEGDACDADDDNDNTPDVSDAFPLDATEDTDTDGDTVGDNADNCPVVANAAQTDTDGDAAGDACDIDDDNDGVADVTDSAPLNPNSCSDNDADSCDDCSVGADGFGPLSDQLVNNDGLDTDTDGACNVGDLDDDGDGLSDVQEALLGTDPLLADTDGDLTLDPLDNCPTVANVAQTDTDGDAAGDACDIDDDNDGVADVTDNAPLNPNSCSDNDADSCDDCSVGMDGFGPLSDQLVNNDGLDTDTDGACNVGDLDDDNDGLSDIAEGLLGTNPLLPDTDNDTVGDATDNCPLTVNATQTDTDNDNQGDACDADDDNDGLTDFDEGIRGTNPLLFDTDGGGVDDGTEVSNGTDPLDPADDVVAGVNLTGVWNFIFTSAPGSDSPANCSNKVDGDGETILGTINHNLSDNSLLLTIEGNQLTGNVTDPVTGAFTVTGVVSDLALDLTTAPYVDNTTNDQVTFSVTGAAGGTMTGTVTSDLDGAIPACTEFENMTASLFYAPTGAEVYDGVYAFEFSSRTKRSNNLGFIDQRNNAFPFELGFVGSVVNVHFPDLGPNETFTFSNNTFDPITGAFTFTVDATGNDGNPVINLSWQQQLIFYGVFVGDPATTPGTSGSPIVFMGSRGISREYSGDFAKGGTLTDASNTSEDAYGKRLITKAFARTVLIESGEQADISQIRLGLQSPPLKRLTPNSKLFLQVIDDVNATVLCEGPFIDDGTGSFLYNEQINQPNPNFSTNQFRGGPYSAVNCNTSDATGDQVFDGLTYKVRIVDSGNNGTKETITSGAAVGDDVIVFDSDIDLVGGYQAEVVASGERYMQTPNVFDISVNSATVSRTASGKLLPLSGYFNPYEPLMVSWPAQEPKTDDYQLRTREVGDFVVNRYRSSNVANSVAIPAGKWLEGKVTALRLYAREKTTSTPNTQAWGVSRSIEVRKGVRGMFNIELGSDPQIPFDYRTMQVYLDSTDPAAKVCIVTNIPDVSCAGVSVNDSSNTVTLSMVDNFSGLTLTGASPPSFTLVLNFKVDGVMNSAQAVVTSPDLSGLSSFVVGDPALRTASARAVNTEVIIRSQRLSTGGIRSLIVGINLLYNPVYDLGLFMSNTPGNIFVNDFTGDIDTSRASEVLWDDAIAGDNFLDHVAVFSVVPTDDTVPQLAGNFGFHATQAGGAGGWGYGIDRVLKADTYKFVARDSSAVEPDIISRVDYAANNPAAYITATLADVDVVLPNGSPTTCGVAGACDVNNPVVTGADAAGFVLRWIVPTAPVGSNWGLFVRNLTTLETVRTRRMLPDVAGSEITSVDNGDTTTTYTWTNPGDIIAPVGQTLEINIVLTSSESGSQFANIGVMVPAHRVHVTQ